MGLEKFKKRSMELGSNPERINETKNDLKQQYINAVKRLALEKIRNDILFEGQLKAAMRNLLSLGLEVSRESMLKDIETEANKQRIDYNIDFDRETPNIIAKSQSEIKPSTQVDDELEQLKNSFGSIFASVPVQEQKPINFLGTIPREPAMQSPRQYETPTNNFSQESQQVVQPVQVYTEQEKQEIREKLQQAQEELSKTIEWAKQQPNKVTLTYTGSLTNLSDDVKKRIIQQMEARGKVNISEIENIYQEDNYIVVDAKDNQGRFTSAEFTISDFSKLVNQSSININHTANSQQPIENNINQHSILGKQSVEIISPLQQVIQQGTKQDLQYQQRQIKDRMIGQIIEAMYNTGEFLFDGISMGERMNIMQNVQNNLNAKSMGELQILLTAYQEKVVQEETVGSGVHR